MSKNEQSCRLGVVGGQAVIEGVMMKSGESVSLAVRKDDGTIEIKNSTFTPLKNKHRWLNIPILRGIIGFFESMVLSFKTLADSTDMLGLEDEEPKKKKKKKEDTISDGDSEKSEEKKKDSSGMTVAIMAVSLILGLGLVLVLFNILPATVANFVGRLTHFENPYFMAAIEGVVKVIIFIAYLLSVSLMKDIRRTFQYHGAEHKSIACYESGMELTPENARKCTRFHPRCGTSFLFVMVIISIIISMFIPFWGSELWIRYLIKIAITPLIMGVGFEFIKFAGKHNNVLTRILSAPGLWMQRITTKEPDDYQLAVAICAIKSSMPEEFPDFDPSIYFISREENKGHIAYEEQKKTEESK